MERVEIGDAVLLHGDCREILPTLGQVHSCITDPPYHGVKADAWDNQWKTDADFLEFVGEIVARVDAILAPTGSFYWFCSPQMAARIEVKIAERFRVLNNIVWDKAGTRKGVGGTGIDVSALRCFWSANTERVIFAERYDDGIGEPDASEWQQACATAKASIFGAYLRSEFARANVTNKSVARLFPSATGNVTGCVSNWLLGYNIPTEDQYRQIRDFLGEEFLSREYAEMRDEYEKARQDFDEMHLKHRESLRLHNAKRRPFALSDADQWGDVWRFDIERGTVHPTQKPLALMSHIVKASSRPGECVLDPFAGSGTTGVACAKLGRRFIGIEKDQKHFATACRRIEEAYKQADLFVPPPASKPVQTTLFAGEAA